MAKIFISISAWPLYTISILPHDSGPQPPSTQYTVPNTRHPIPRNTHFTSTMSSFAINERFMTIHRESRGVKVRDPEPKKRKGGQRQFHILYWGICFYVTSLFLLWPCHWPVIWEWLVAKNDYDNIGGLPTEWTWTWFFLVFPAKQSHFPAFTYLVRYKR